MSDSVEKDLNKPALPNLVGKVFAAIFALWLVIFLGQLLQDHYQKEEILDIRRIDSYYQQVELASQVVVGILQLQSTDRGAEQDRVSALFVKNVSELKATHTVLHDIMQQYQALSETDNLQAEEPLLEDYIDELILHSNEILAMIDAEAVNKAMLSDIYHKILPVYQKNQKESIQLIRKLSAYLEQESKEHRQTIWWSTLGIMLVVLMLGFAFYRRTKRLVHQQFNLIGSTNKELEQDNQLRRQNELALAEQTK